MEGGLSIFEIGLAKIKEEWVAALPPFALMRRVHRRAKAKVRVSWRSIVLRKMAVLNEIRRVVTARRCEVRYYFDERDRSADGGGAARIYEDLAEAPRSPQSLAPLIRELSRDPERARHVSRSTLARAKAGAVVEARRQIAPVEAESARVAGALACNAVFERRQHATRTGKPKDFLGSAALARAEEHKRAHDRCRITGRARCLACDGILVRNRPMLLDSDAIHGGQCVETPANELKAFLAPRVASLRKQLRSRLLAARGGAAVVRNAAAAHLQRALSVGVALGAVASGLAAAEASRRRYLGRRIFRLRRDCGVAVGDDVERAIACEESGDAFVPADLEDVLVDVHAPWLPRSLVRSALYAYARRRHELILSLQRGFRSRRDARALLEEKRRRVHDTKEGRIDALRAAADAAHERQRRTRACYALPTRKPLSRGGQLQRTARVMFATRAPPRDAGEDAPSAPLPRGAYAGKTPCDFRAAPLTWAVAPATPRTPRTPRSGGSPAVEFAALRQSPARAYRRRASIAKPRTSRSAKSVSFAPAELLHEPHRLEPLSRKGTAASSRASSRGTAPSSAGSDWRHVHTAGSTDPRPMSGVSCASFDYDDDGDGDAGYDGALRRGVGDVPLLGRY